MNKFNWFFIGVIGVLLAVIYWYPCDCNKVAPKVVTKFIDRKNIIVHKYEQSIDTKKQKIAILKKSVAITNSPIPVIKQVFDSTATIDMVKKELVKAVGVIEKQADTISNLREVVQLQDSIQVDNDSLVFQEKSIANNEKSEADSLRKIIKKERRKAFWAKIGSGIAVVGAGIVFINPGTGAAVIVAGATILVVSNIRSNK